MEKKSQIVKLSKRRRSKKSVQKGAKIKKRKRIQKAKVKLLVKCSRLIGKRLQHNWKLIGRIQNFTI